MYFSIQKDAFLNCLQSLQSIIEKKSTYPILGNFLCEVTSEGLSLSATDLEVGIRMDLPVQNGTSGKITVAAKQVFEIVKELPNSTVSFQSKENDWVEIKCEKSRFNIVGLSASQYPSLPFASSRNFVEANTKQLSEMIEKTLFAVSSDTSRIAMTGVYFEKVDAGLFRMIATDGHRLTYVDHELFKTPPELKKGFIIPRKGIVELKKMLDSSKETVFLCFDQGYLYAKNEQVSLFIKLIDGDYPDYRQVIPKSIENHLTLPKETFFSATKRVSLIANEKSKAVRFSLDKNLLTISSSSAEFGEANEEVDVEYDGPAVQIGFNARYLLDCLPQIRSEKIEFRFKDRSSPCQIQGTEQRNHLYIIMPMRV